MGAMKRLYEEVSERLEEELGREPTDEEINDYISGMPDYVEYSMEDR